MDRLLLLGATGTLGRALEEAFRGDFVVVGQSRASGFDAEDLSETELLLQDLRPAVVANAVVLSGLEACEREPERAFRLNALFPRKLAQSSREQGFRLIHFSTDAVFDDMKGEIPRVESDAARPLNTYGITKLAGDCFVAAEAERYYIHRLSVLFGPSGRTVPFIGRMVEKARGSGRMRIADDVFCSPSSSHDVAARVRECLIREEPWGLYHTANQGRASLFQLMEQVHRLHPFDPVLERSSHAEFGTGVNRSTTTSLSSEKQAPLRDWQEALAAWCGTM